MFSHVRIDLLVRIVKVDKVQFIHQPQNTMIQPIVLKKTNMYVLFMICVSNSMSFWMSFNTSCYSNLYSVDIRVLIHKAVHYMVVQNMMIQQIVLKKINMDHSMEEITVLHMIIMVHVIQLDVVVLVSLKLTLNYTN